MQKLLRKVFSVKPAGPCVTAADLAAHVRSAAKLGAARLAERRAYEGARCRCRYPGLLCRTCEHVALSRPAAVAAQRLRTDQARMRTN